MEWPAQKTVESKIKEGGFEAEWKQNRLKGKGQVWKTSTFIHVATLLSLFYHCEIKQLRSNGALRTFRKFH